MSDLIETIEDGIATLTMNRPEARNAFTSDMSNGLAEATYRLANDPSVRVIVLTGAGGAFCAGGDVKSFAQASKGANPSTLTFEAKVADLRRRMEASRWLYEAPKPTLAVIPGAAAGAGLSLALACDLRISTDTAKLTTAFSKVGVAGDFGASYFLSQLVGTAKAREMFFFGETITGAQAAQLGIVNHAVPADDLPKFAADYARKLKNLPTAAISYMKRNLNMALHSTLSQNLDQEAVHMVRSMMTEDHKTASLAFVEKRAPEFAGR